MKPRTIAAIPANHRIQRATVFALPAVLLSAQARIQTSPPPSLKRRLMRPSPHPRPWRPLLPRIRKRARRTSSLLARPSLKSREPNPLPRKSLSAPDATDRASRAHVSASTAGQPSKNQKPARPPRKCAPRTRLPGPARPRPAPMAARPWKPCPRSKAQPLRPKPRRKTSKRPTHNAAEPLRAPYNPLHPHKLSQETR